MDFLFRKNNPFLWMFSVIGLVLGGGMALNGVWQFIVAPMEVDRIGAAFSVIIFAPMALCSIYALWVTRGYTLQKDSVPLLKRIIAYYIAPFAGALIGWALVALIAVFRKSNY